MDLRENLDRAAAAILVRAADSAAEERPLTAPSRSAGSNPSLLAAALTSTAAGSTSLVPSLKKRTAGTPPEVLQTRTRESSENNPSLAHTIPQEAPSDHRRGTSSSLAQNGHVVLDAGALAVHTDAMISSMTTNDRFLQLIAGVVGTAVQHSLSSLPSTISGIVGAQIQPVARAVEEQRSDLQTLAAASSDLARRVEALEQRPLPAAVGAGGAAEATGLGTPRGLNPMWQPRVGVMFVGGYPRDTAREVIVRHLKSVTAHAVGVRSCWCPEKRWSNGRVQFIDDSALFIFLEMWQSRPDNSFRFGQQTCEIWMAKEKSLAKKDLDSKTSWVARKIRERLETLDGWDPAKYQVMFLGRAVWFADLKIAEADKNNVWTICDLSSIGMSDVARELQAEVNNF